MNTIRFLTNKNIFPSKNCLKKDTNLNEIWLAADDEVEEGTWRTWYNNTMVEYLPWTPKRPYIGGTDYNCFELQLELSDNGEQILQVNKAQVVDEECSKEFCVLCEVMRPTLEIHVRGLCQHAKFDRTYMYNIGKNGNQQC